MSKSEYLKTQGFNIKIFIINAVFLTSLLISCQIHAFSQIEPKDKIDTCLNLLGSYSNYWKKDSIGDNGFRELLGYRVINSCDCTNRKWKYVFELLGNPNFIYLEANQTKYRYRLNNYNNDIKHPGTLLLDIFVNQEGVIVKFSIWEVDG